MKTKNTKSFGYMLVLFFLSSCALFKNSPVEYAIDPVCGMKVSKSEAFNSKYNGNEYYFDSYNCKESFKMNPENYVKNKK